MRVAPLALAALLLASCQGSPRALTTPTPVPVPSPTTPAPTTTLSPTPPAPSPSPLWVVGASPLPLRADGFGQVLPTPVVLRNRRLPTKDLLPPPEDGRFHATTARISDAVRTRMGESYRPGCPVPITDLRYLTLSFRGFDGRAHTGELVVAAKAAASTVRVFRALFAQGFPIEEMRLPTTADLTAPPTGDGNDTAAFVCRAARGQKRFSAHAYGLAIDVDPFQNPFVRDDLVLPELASAYRDRSWSRPGMMLRGSAAVRAFTREGWTWGGDFHRPKDYQHFSLTGN
ncbi:MAG TPA: M15 family metallopeptidase [Mycobacteriales bacterium]|nr:M15 family metallopeptidase [Mycobacteriales bacterium]